MTSPLYPCGCQLLGERRAPPMEKGWRRSEEQTLLLRSPASDQYVQHCTPYRSSPSHRRRSTTSLSCPGPACENPLTHTLTHTSTHKYKHTHTIRRRRPGPCPAQGVRNAPSGLGCAGWLRTDVGHLTDRHLLGLGRRSQSLPARAASTSRFGQWDGDREGFYPHITLTSGPASGSWLT